MSPSDRVETEVDGRRLSLSHLDKVMFPETGFTKGQLIDYYAHIAPVMLPHVIDRPVTFRRYPDGVDSKSFFEKHVPSHAPKWVRTVEVPSTSSRGGGSEVEHPLISDLPALVWAANLAVIEFHVPLWRVGRRRKLPAPPDQMVFDLDPGPGATIVECCRVAQWIAEVMADEGSEPLAKTSGSKGMQLYVPLTGRPTWERTRDRAHDLAIRLESDHPEMVVSSMTKAHSEGQGLHRLEPEFRLQNDRRRLLGASPSRAHGFHPGGVGRSRGLRGQRGSGRPAVHHR